MQSILADAGPLIALFLQKDAYHQRAMAFAKNCRARLLTTCAVVTEVCHFLNAAGKQKFLTFIKRGGVEVRTMSTDDLDAIIALIGKYADQDMDFADASLVWLANQTGISDIITIDRKDFAIYHTDKGKPFRNCF